MLMEPVRAASSHKANRSMTSPVPLMATSLIGKFDSCHRMMARPTASPTGTRAMDQIGIR